ncbi:MULTISPECIES: hypothetical protein [unclassified Streptomyces]|nr:MULTISPECIES: hypothetical protein [unclassified Streptomyces]MCX5332047.1 hypothetical protein [Streptomyces sp. NBC_00140]MCX5361448.1 hypothetical protein [Streptomyces sp. NBC_00124]
MDLRRSSKPKKGTGQMKQTVFRPDALPADLPAFRRSSATIWRPA